MRTDEPLDVPPRDVLIVGAGVSGSGIAEHLGAICLGKRNAVFAAE